MHPSSVAALRARESIAIDGASGNHCKRLETATSFSDCLSSSVPYTVTSANPAEVEYASNRHTPGAIPSGPDKPLPSALSRWKVGRSPSGAG
jgi:hypothetical protein